MESLIISLRIIVLFLATFNVELVRGFLAFWRISRENEKK